MGSYKCENVKTNIMLKIVEIVDFWFTIEIKNLINIVWSDNDSLLLVTNEEFTYIQCFIGDFICINLYTLDVNALCRWFFNLRIF